MIEELDLDKDISEMQINIWQKLNEIIEALNNMEKVMDFEESHNFIANAAKKAAMSGSREDLQEYLRLRKLYGLG